MAPSATEPVARCVVVKLEGEEAECSVQIDGYEVSRVSFPAWVLKAKMLGVGARFHWMLSGAGRVRPGDIDTDVPQSDDLTAEEEARLDDLERNYRQRREADHGEWPESTGDGR